VDGFDSKAKAISILWLLSFAFSSTFIQAVASSQPIVIAHRGACGYRPEHTIGSYGLAVDMGADFIEPDLVPTKDGVLVARHENEISTTTDIASHPEFAIRQCVKVVDGRSVKGWFTEDFTLAELKTLRAQERMPKIRQHNTIYDGRYGILTLQEIFDFVKKRNREQKRIIGIYPEIKHPSYFKSIGFDTTKLLLDGLLANGYRDSSSPVFIQCFEPTTLKALHAVTSINLIQLIDDDLKPYDFVLNKDSRTWEDILTPAGLAEVRTYARGIGPAKNRILKLDESGKLLKPTRLIDDAHKVGLIVHPWTFRNENAFLPLDYRSANNSLANDSSANKSSANKSFPKNSSASVAESIYPSLYGDAFAEYKMFYDLGVDGVFSENPDTALEARTSMNKDEQG
jgi:glycerophosphoryl diester phosphodiesterase